MPPEPIEHWHWYCSHSNLRAPGGQPGRPGENGPPGDPGPVGRSGTVRIDATDWGALAERFSAHSLHFVLRAAERAYLAGDLASAHNKLGWLANLGASAANQEVAAIGTHARTLLAQMEGGLDFFGHLPNYAPIVAQAQYSSLAVDWLEYVKELEQLQKECLDDANKAALDLQRFDEALTSVTGARKLLVRSITEGEALISLLTPSIERLRGEQVAAEEVLRRDGERYRDAVVQRVREESGGDCDFGQILVVAGSVVSVASGVWAGAAGILGTIKGLGGVSLSLQGMGQILKAVNAVSADVKNIAGAFRSLGTTLNGASPEQAKIFVVREEFERMTDDFIALIHDHLDPHEAEAYRAVVRRFLDVVAARNQQILALNALQTCQAELRADLARRDQEVARLRDARLQLDDSAGERWSFMVRASDDAKGHLLRAIDQEQKAFDYWGLEHNGLTVASFSYVSLKGYHEELRSRLVAKYEARTRPSQAFSVPPIELNDDTAPDFLACLRATGRALLRLRLDRPEFLGLREVLVDKIALRIEGARAADHRLLVFVTHQGDAMFRTVTGDVVSFSHDPRRTFVKYDNLQVSDTATASLGGEDGKYAYLSPFATWTIEFPRVGNVGLETRDIRKVVIGFEAFGLAPYDS